MKGRSTRPMTNNTTMKAVTTFRISGRVKRSELPGLCPAPITMRATQPRSSAAAARRLPSNQLVICPSLAILKPSPGAARVSCPGGGFVAARACPRRTRLGCGHLVEQLVAGAGYPLRRLEASRAVAEDLGDVRAEPGWPRFRILAARARRSAWELAGSHQDLAFWLVVENLLAELGHDRTLPARRLLVRVRVEGVEHLPRDGAAILAANHLSFFDSVLSIFDLPRQVRMLGKA